jgi:murein DD-endopeptidase MepM/ murein hydrolase activator NlpD
LALALAGTVAWSSLVITRDVDYQSAQEAQRNFDQTMKAIQSELANNRDALSRMAQLDAQFRKLLKLGDRKKVFELNGMGGPTQADATDLTNLMKEKDERLFAKVSDDLKTANKMAAQQEASFKEISVFLDKQRSILGATPSLWPVKGWITSGYGKRASPLTGEPGRHMGVDIANEVNTPIRSTADGLVTYAGWQSGYGRVIVVEHGFGFSTRYGHCARVEVKVGDEVKRGDILGYVGSTGRSTGSHVHYEVRVHGMPVDPEKYLPKQD